MAGNITRQAAGAFSLLISRKLKRTARWCGWLVIALSALTLLGWAGNIDWLKYPFGAQYVTKVNTAVCLLFSGLSLVCLPSGKPVRRTVGYLLAVLVLAMGVATICEYLLGIHITPDELFQKYQSVTYVPPTRIPPSMSVILILGALGLLYVPSGKQETLSLVVTTIGLMAVFSYLFGTREMAEVYGVGFFAGVRLDTHLNLVGCASIALLGVGILLSEPKRVLNGLLCSPTRGGFIARRFLPLVMGVPLLVGAMSLSGEHAHLYGSPMRWIIFINCSILCFVWFTCFISKRLDELDLSRIHLEERRADIVYSLAHDLKVPIIGTERAIDIMLSGKLGELKPQQRSFLTQILDSANDQLQLIDNLVYEYRSEQGKEPLVRSTCCVTRLLNDCLAKLVPVLRSKNLQIKVKHKIPLYAFAADPVAMRRVINNLLYNAMKYTPTGGELKISSGLEGELFSFTVWNSADISDNYKKHLFERFWQSEEARRLTSGNGLGLYVCRQIVTAHGGTISCQSEPTQGTSFTVVLPTTDIHLSVDD